MILSCNRPQIRAKLYHEREAERLEKQRREKELQRQRRNLMIQKFVSVFRNIRISWK